MWLRPSSAAKQCSQAVQPAASKPSQGVHTTTSTAPKLWSRSSRFPRSPIPPGKNVTTGGPCARRGHLKPCATSNATMLIKCQDWCVCLRHILT